MGQIIRRLASLLLCLLPVSVLAAPPSPHDLLEKRCTVCHGCFDAPCQLKLTAHDGLLRGASQARVYDGTRLLAIEPSRLFEDASTPEAWRKKGFFPVLPAPGQSPEQGTLWRMLALKQAHPLPPGPVLPGSFDFSLDRAQQCVKPGEFDRFASRFPLWGMPYGLPGLSPGEHGALTAWLAAGAPAPAEAPLSAGEHREINRWETFLNGDDLKQRLVSRYIYEHLFLAALYFADLPSGPGERRYFQLVRSASPPGRPLERISTRRPYDDPGVARVYYRLVPAREATLAKTHMPYRLDQRRLQRWESLFYRTPYPVTRWPGYDPRVASNPFAAFAELPMEARYRFMLDEAQFTIMGFIKGPVCRGQIALNVINDQFWVFFLDPALTTREQDERFFLEESGNLRLPAEQSDAPVLSSWLAYALLERRYLDAKVTYIPQQQQLRARGLELLWNGDGHNDNAALTIFRHFDSATVVKGLAGDTPKTVWVMGYPLLERIHYLLVAGFDVFGNVGHQFTTRVYMDFLRMEGELNFLAFLPEPDRRALLAHWYRDAPGYVRDYLAQVAARYDFPLPIDYRTRDHKTEMLDQFRQHLGPVLDSSLSLERVADGAVRQPLRQLAVQRGRALSWLPEITLLHVPDANGDRWFTLLRNSAHSNIAHLFAEENRRLPDEDTLTVLRGVVGAYPNVFLRVPRAELPALAQRIAGLRDEAGYAAFLDKYGIRRTSEGFWAISDALHRDMQGSMGIEYGLLDYNRLENR